MLWGFPRHTLCNISVGVPACAMTLSVFHKRMWQPRPLDNVMSVVITGPLHQ